MKARSGREAFALVAVYVCSVVVLLAVFGVVDMNEQSYIDQIDPPVYAVDPPVTDPAREPVPTPTTVQSEEGAASSDAVLVPGSLAAPLVTRGTAISDDLETVPSPAAGDCDGWADVFAFYGATPAEVAFFVPAIIDSESGCGRDTLNESTGDTGVCQINPVHNRAGYFGRRYFDAGGWLSELHGLTTRADTANPAWADACLTLYRVCGPGPWRPPYSCANRSLPVLNPEGPAS